MKPKQKKQRLANNPYLSEQLQPQPHHPSASLSYRTNKLNNSMYSPQQTFELVDYQTENKKLKEELALFREEASRKESEFKKQVQGLKDSLQRKMERISYLEEKIMKMEEESRRKSENMKDRLMECGDIVKELEGKQFRSNAHSLLETSRIEKFLINDQTNNSIINGVDQHQFNTNRPSSPFGKNIANREQQENVYTQCRKGQFVPCFGNQRTNVFQNTSVADGSNNKKSRIVEKQVFNQNKIVFNFTPPKTISHHTSPMNNSLHRQQLAQNSNSNNSMIINKTTQQRSQNHLIHPLMAQNNRSPSHSSNQNMMTPIMSKPVSPLNFIGNNQNRHVFPSNHVVRPQTMPNGQHFHNPNPNIRM